MPLNNPRIKSLIAWMMVTLALARGAYIGIGAYQDDNPRAMPDGCTIQARGHTATSCQSCCASLYPGYRFFALQDGTISIGPHCQCSNDWTLATRYGHGSCGTVGGGMCNYIYETCQAGEYQDGSTCSPCPADQFSDTWGQTSCQTCAAGKVQPLPGQSSCVYSPTLNPTPEPTYGPTLHPTPRPTAQPVPIPTFTTRTSVTATLIESPVVKTDLIDANRILLGGVPLVSGRRLNALDERNGQTGDGSILYGQPAPGHQAPCSVIVQKLEVELKTAIEVLQNQIDELLLEMRASK